ncbi:Gfo/Idh/MocA family oxidoreductase [Pelagicoccus sp. SDUM812002]|uniref:Gfo/Idh/MocA family protein n=1 Tax=Pelagicoccus sp. SDUM812002 TaxID=3041266 RepID=UPI00280ED544|nr:Gfo/Idh/MocA family oxidoreductase [Pelagicoccus sp. SDUM812002]MDQ8188385.1 Gfo/Idh/MocA family oxidoreductase [Pelagicoccus sp. SDUM812002]
MSIRVLLAGAGPHGFEAYANGALLKLMVQSRVEPIAVVEPNVDRRNAALQSLGLSVTAGFASLAPALGLKPDLVIVATPYFAHEEACLAAAAAGAHLFIEKPLSDSMASCWRIHNAIQRAGVKAAVNMSARFESEKRAFEEALAEGRAGKIEYLFGRMSWNHESNAKYRVDVPYPYLNEGGIHLLELLRACAGGKPVRVHHMAYRSPDSVFKGFPNSVVSFEMDNGVCCVLEGSWTVKAGINVWRKEYLRADGSEGALLLDQQRLKTVHGTGWTKESLKEKKLGDFSNCQANLGTEFLLTAFIDWIEGCTSEHPTNLATNLQLMALLFSAFESAETKQVVDVQATLEAGRREASRKRDSD